ncbi:GNAT superfamily N-acetyltransferase [Rhizobium sp. BK181]|uniref:GNAT family N-acetyltransferase n=1 Tax=Rhizobium sp. BK181 TaxID=2587072 RepID=UPI00161009AD|nr:GNAT family N-acetyltransferase [Rhizobium sp. BK181]MBB3315496.1 GNAT superfamily N-acetyltransferase [Rhizobium sp. BK181]
MMLLSAAARAVVYQTYRASEFFYPLIGAVLLGTQDGVVFADDDLRPTQIYVEHSFGFAQIIGTKVDRFEEELEGYLLFNKQFTPVKVRLYAPYLPNFLLVEGYDILRSWRQRFTISPDSPQYRNAKAQPAVPDVVISEANSLDFGLIENAFQLACRFWRTPADFIEHAHAIVVRYKGEPASVCYAAAEVDRRAEIDVLTLPQYRGLGLGRVAVTNFVDRCFDSSCMPLWDCFTNNTGSMALAASVGFTAIQPPYPFFTIAR